MKYQPSKNRVIVKVINNDYEKTESGLLLDSEATKTESKNNLIRAKLVAVGSKCEDFAQENVGLIVLIHEVGGVPMSGVNPDYRIMREDDIWAYSTEQEHESISVEDAFNSDLAEKIRRGEAS